MTFEKVVNIFNNLFDKSMMLDYIINMLEIKTI